MNHILPVTLDSNRIALKFVRGLDPKRLKLVYCAKKPRARATILVGRALTRQARIVWKTLKVKYSTVDQAESLHHDSIWDENENGRHDQCQKNI
jgi:predicted NAD-dependent protein-ADP-ribosyltransferase YbiA (DUF1768 family)